MDSSEVVGRVKRPAGVCEVCADAQASYDEDHRRLVVQLSSFLRTTDLRSKERQLTAPWLPPRETVQESVAQEESVELARDIFHRWAHKVQQAMPGSGHG